MLKPRVLGAALVSLVVLVASTLVTLPAATAAPSGTSSPQVLCNPSTSGGQGPLAPSGGFHSITPERLLDTRATLGAIDAGCTVVVDLSGAAPSTATGAALDVIAVDAAQAGGYLTVYPCGSSRPLASNLNPLPGEPTPNAVVLPVDGTHRACIYTAVRTQIVVDLTGWFGPGGASFHAAGPTRALDTRSAPRPDGGSGQLLAGQEVRLSSSAVGLWPATAAGVVVNLTVTNTAGPGFLTAYPCGTTRPWTSTGNYAGGDTRAVQAFVGLGGGDLCIYTSTTVDLIVDVNGWFAGGDGTRAIAMSGTRVVDSRNGTGGWSTPLAAGEVRSFDPTLDGTVPVGAAAVLDVVATNSTGDNAYVTLYPCGGPPPTVSAVNPTPGAEATNVTVVPLGEGGRICVFSSQPTDLVIDVNASFGAAGALQGLSVNPGTLIPAFSPDAHDYGVICSTGTNNWLVSAQGVPGSSVSISGASPSGAVSIAENGLVTITVTKADSSTEQYFVRCLPHDFPQLQVSRPDDPTPGWYLTTTGIQAPAGTTYAMILDSHGAPVWYHKTATPVIDPKVMPNGDLAWTPLRGQAFGTDPTGGYEEHSLDGTLVHEWATNGTPTDQHDMYPLPNGDVLLISYHERDGVDVSALGAGYGTNENVVDGWIQEIRPDGSVAWQWHSEDHIGVSETVAQRDGVQIVFNIASGPVVDLLHINSVDVDPATGDLIVSARHLDAVFRIRRDPGQPDDGQVVWKLGGDAPTSPSTTHLTILGDPLGGPARQHDARIAPNGDLTMFDNRTQTGTASRAVEYKLDLAAGTATLVWQDQRTDGLAAFGLGSVRRQPDGSVAICWGGDPPLLTDIDPSGSVALEVSQGGGGITYRSIKEPLSTFDAATLRADAGT